MMTIHSSLRLIILSSAFLLLNGMVYGQRGTFIRFTSVNAMFPDTARANGHDYNGKHYDALTHYSDSSVLIYVPKNFSPKGKLNLIFWFHGWSNNIDTAYKQYELVSQFEASGRNAILVFPEGPKNAPDSYGGKLEQPAVFQALTKDVVQQLERRKILPGTRSFDINNYNISLAGHSGAYRVISRILNKTPVQEVILFDAMYGGNEYYLEWLSKPEHRFVNIYTRDGGTYENSKQIAKLVADSLGVPVISVDEPVVNAGLLQLNKKIFIFSEQTHNGVITHNNNWELFLRGEKKEETRRFR